MTNTPMTNTDIEKLVTMLVTFFPNRIPAATAKAWLLSFTDRRASDVARGIQTMAEQSDFPTLKGLIDSVRDAVRERTDAETAAKEAATKKLEAGLASTVNTEANVRLLGLLVAAIKRGDSAEAIETMVREDLATRGDA